MLISCLNWGSPLTYQIVVWKRPVQSNFTIESPSVSVCVLFVFCSLPSPLPPPLSLCGHEADASTETGRQRRKHPQGQALHQPPPAAPTVGPSSVPLPASSHRYPPLDTLFILVLTDTHTRHMHSPPGRTWPHPITFLCNACFQAQPHPV